MTTAEGDDLCFLYCTRSMKSLMREAVLALYFRLVPLLRLQIKSPQIIEVWAARFSSHNDHESVNQCGSMVGSGSRQVKLIDLFIVWLIVSYTFDEFGHIYRPLWRLRVAAIWFLDEWICIIVFFSQWKLVGLVEEVNGLSLLILLKSDVLITNFGKFWAI